MLPIIAVQLHKLREVRFGAERLFDVPLVEHKAVRSELDTRRKPLR